jgi:hypothetical protein
VSPPARAANALRRAFEFTQRERRFVVDQLAQVRGLMPLLMKRRNRSKWTLEDLAEIRVQFIRLRSLSPYLAMLLLPGGFFALPLMAWWLDRRRERRDSAATDGPGRP